MNSSYEMFTSSISEIYRYVQKIEREEMAKYGLRGPYARYLIAMERYEERGVTMTSLSQICEMDKAAVSRAIVELEEEGLLYRQEINGNYYRAPLHLTEKGKIVAKEVNAKAQMAVEKTGDKLTKEQRENFYEVLHLVSENLKEICAEGIEG